jgi:hypothetical protein
MTRSAAKRHSPDDIVGLIFMGRTHDITISGFDLDMIEAGLRKAISERNKARESVREMRDILKGMNFGDSFPVVQRAIKNANDILSNTSVSYDAKRH